MTETPASGFRDVDIDIEAFTAAVAEIGRRLREALEPIFRAVTEAIRPLAALLERYPELAEVRIRQEPSGCHHLCGRSPVDHECLGEADGEFAYEPGGHAIPMCAPCRVAADHFQPEPIRRVLDGGPLARRANWPEQGSTTCAHVCGPDPNHVCGAGATETLTYALPSGGTRTMPLCGPCHTSESASLAETG